MWNVLTHVVEIMEPVVIPQGDHVEKDTRHDRDHSNNTTYSEEAKFNNKDAYS